MAKFRINRRAFITSATVGGSGLMLSGCDVFDNLSNPDNGLRNFFEGANNLTYRVQRLLGGGYTMAQEFTEADIRQPQRPNGVTAPDDSVYKGLLSNDFADWRLERDRPGRKAAVAHPRPAEGDAEPHPDHPPRLRRRLELHRQMDRHAAVAGARRGEGQAASALRRLPLPGFDRALAVGRRQILRLDRPRSTPTTRRPFSPTGSTASRCRSRTARRCACASSGSSATRCRNTSTRSSWSRASPRWVSARAATGKTAATTGSAASEPAGPAGVSSPCRAAAAVRDAATMPPA